jgi:hypothetical protein
MRQHAHGRIVRSVPEPVHAVRDSVRTCIAARGQAFQMVAVFSGVLGDLNVV